MKIRLPLFFFFSKKRKTPLFLRHGPRHSMKPPRIEGTHVLIKGANRSGGWVSGATTALPLSFIAIAIYLIFKLVFVGFCHGLSGRHLSNADSTSPTCPFRAIMLPRQHRCLFRWIDRVALEQIPFPTALRSYCVPIVGTFESFSLNIRVYS